MITKDTKQGTVTTASELKVGQTIKTAYSSVEVVRRKTEGGWIKIWYRTTSGFVPEKPFNFRSSHPVTIL